MTQTKKRLESQIGPKHFNYFYERLLNDDKGGTHILHMLPGDGAGMCPNTKRAQTKDLRQP